MIQIWNIISEVKKEFESLEQLASFLAEEVESHLWRGHEHLGPLPAVEGPVAEEADHAAEPVAPEPEAAETVSEPVLEPAEEVPAVSPGV